MFKNLKVVVLVILIMILVCISCVLVMVKPSNKYKKNKIDKTTVTTNSAKVNNKYEMLEVVNSTQASSAEYKLEIKNKKLIIEYGDKQIKYKGISKDVKYVAAIDDFVSYEPIFVVQDDENDIYISNILKDTIEFYKLNSNKQVQKLILVDEPDYDYAGIKQPFVLLKDGTLRKVDYNLIKKEVRLGNTYEQRYIDLFLWGTGGLVIRIDQSNNNLVKSKSEYSKRENGVVTTYIDFKNMKYNDKDINCKYAILSDDTFSLYVVNTNNEIIYVKQDENTMNENVNTLEKYNDKKVKEIIKKSDKIVEVRYMDDTSEELSYSKLYGIN